VHWVVPVAVVQREARFDKSATDITSRRCEQVITGQRVAVAAEHCADFIAEFCLLGGNIYRTEIGPGETRAGHELLLITGWEESGRPHLARTVPNLAQPS
jgi:hypothetical protein